MAGRNVLVFVAGDVAVRIGGAAFVPHPLFVVGRDAVELDAPDALAGDFVGIGADLARRFLAAVGIDQQPAPRRIFEQVGVEVDLAYAFAVHEVHLDALYADRRDRVQKAAHLAVVVRRIVELLPMAPYEQPDAARLGVSGQLVQEFPFVGTLFPPVVDGAVLDAQRCCGVDHPLFAFEGHEAAVDAAPPAPQRASGDDPRRVGEQFRVGSRVETGDDVGIYQCVEVAGDDRDAPRGDDVA